MSDPKPEPTLTPDEKQALADLKDKVRKKDYRTELRLKRKGPSTYAQNQALRKVKRVAAEKKKKDYAKERAASVERRQRAYALWCSGMSKAQVSIELAVAYDTVLRWLKGKERPAVVEGDPIIDALETEVKDAVADEMLMARDDEEKAIAELADTHDNPADQYQAYVAGKAIRILRDNIGLVRGPRTIRELDQLDQLIRRSLGLNPRGGANGGGNGALHIDISILNNTKASKGAVGRVVTVEAE